MHGEPFPYLQVLSCTADKAGMKVGINKTRHYDFLSSVYYIRTGITGQKIVSLAYIYYLIAFIT